MYQPKTLYDVIKQVESAYDLVSQYTPVEKQAGLRRVFEDDIWRNNRVLKDVVAGRTTFSKEAKRYEEIKNKEIERFSDLGACFGNPPPSIVGNPLYGGVEGAVAGAVLSAITLDKKTTRREIIKRSGIAALLLGACGVFTGWGERGMYKRWLLNDLEQEAKYLDQVYTSTAIR